MGVYGEAPAPGGEKKGKGGRGVRMTIPIKGLEGRVTAPEKLLPRPVKEEGEGKEVKSEAPTQARDIKVMNANIDAQEGEDRPISSPDPKESKTP